MNRFHKMTPSPRLYKLPSGEGSKDERKAGLTEEHFANNILTFATNYTETRYNWYTFSLKDFSWAQADWKKEPRLWVEEGIQGGHHRGNQSGQSLFSFRSSSSLSLTSPQSHVHPQPGSAWRPLAKREGSGKGKTKFNKDFVKVPKGITKGEDLGDNNEQYGFCNCGRWLSLWYYWLSGEYVLSWRWDTATAPQVLKNIHR